MKTHSDTKSPHFLTPTQLAQRWCVATITLRRWRKAGKLQVHYFGRLVRFSLTDVEKIEADSKA